MDDPTSGRTPPLPAPRGHLTEAQRRELDAILAARPGASAGRVAALFRARTGREIARITVQKRRKAAYKARPGNGHLTEAQRAILELLVRESAGEACCRAIADQFEELVGRPISKGAVWYCAVVRLGMPRFGQGKGRRRRQPAAAARLAEASGRKLDRARVDRSQRVGKSGRYLGGG
jgi:hypothetical protein